jgi:hypothetical protein
VAIIEERLDRISHSKRSAPAPPGAAAAPASPRSAAAATRPLLWAWLLLVGSMLLFEPAPARPEPAIPLWATILGTAFTVAFGAAVVGLARRRSWALTASSIAAGTGLLIAVGCAVTDHHSAFWWGYELTVFTTLALLTRVAAAASRRYSSS